MKQKIHNIADILCGMGILAVFVCFTIFPTLAMAGMLGETDIGGSFLLSLIIGGCFFGSSVILDAYAHSEEYSNLRKEEKN